MQLFQKVRPLLDYHWWENHFLIKLLWTSYFQSCMLRISKNRRATAKYVCELWTMPQERESPQCAFQASVPSIDCVFGGSTEKWNCTFANLSLIFTRSHDAIVKAFSRIIGFSIYNRGPKHYFNLFTRLRTMALTRPLGIWRRRFSKSAGIPTRLKGLKYFYNCV